MKKKIMSLMLAFVLALSMCTVAFAAEEEPTDQASFTFTKNFDIVGQGVTSDETFSFTAPVCTDVTDAAAGVTAASENAREDGLPTVSDVSFETALIPQKETVTVTLPEYTSVGIYTYSFEEKKGNTAGVTYDETTYTFTVSVFNGEDDTFVRVPSMIKNDKGDKADSITNVYTANSLSVEKIVKGKLGDKSKEFTVKVKFTAPEGTKVKQSIWAGTSEKTEIIKAGDWENGTAEATISLKNEQTVIFYNIPAGVTYEVTENDYEGEGYTTTYDENKSGTMGAEAISTVITNTKDGGEIETGINLDSVPYILMMVVVCAGVFVLFSKKRMARED